MKIYVDFEKPKTLKQFLLKFFSYTCVGMFNPYIPRSVQTYRDKDCKKIQCPPMRHRSLNDMHRCVTTYFPNVTLEELVKELLAIRPNGYYLLPGTCPNISRSVINWTSIRIRYLPRKSGYKHNWGRVFESLGIKYVTDIRKYQP